jgi:VIT1/CCC1 family predicted Fe2+/Mn2+ transporter
MKDEQLATVVNAIVSDRDRWVEFMMRFELGLEAPDPKRAHRSAGTIAASYIVGGLIPLGPYMLLGNVLTGLWFSVGITLLALLAFGYVKGHYTGINPWRGGLQTVVTGGLAAAAAFFIARLIS